MQLVLTSYFEQYQPKGLLFLICCLWNWQACLVSSHGQDKPVTCSQRLSTLSIQLQSAPIYKRIKVGPPKLHVIRTSTILPFCMLLSMTIIAITSIISLRLPFLILQIFKETELLTSCYFLLPTNLLFPGEAGLLTKYYTMRAGSDEEVVSIRISQQLV